MLLTKVRVRVRVEGRTAAQLENETSDVCCYSSIAVIMFVGIMFADIAYSLQNLSEELYQCRHCLYGFPLKMIKERYNSNRCTSSIYADMYNKYVHT